MNLNTKNLNQGEFLAKSAIIAAIYAALTMFLPFSYLGLQFRIAEILVLLVFIDKRYIYGLTFGCLIANLGSPLGPIDVIFGTLATLIALILISKTKNLLAATLWPAIVNGIIIGLILYYLLDLPFILTAAQVFFGEFVVVTIMGYFLFKRILRDKKLVEIIRFR
ncbi:QueT transporter family protein [Proteiniclasticum sp.]|uniref:QueT transporter family protein n=1 Tax=Proteiniclasticum sp. TaxID=2053595 RepID=UPI00289E2F41|nr:QueT transporter family protein [Proteiniclasticum sp.]